MAASLNKVMLIGNLTRDPEQVDMRGQNTLCKFGIAINRKWKGADGQMKEEVCFVDCECWGRTADAVLQYLTKGRSACVEGRLRLNQWETNEGQKRSKLTVVAENVQFLGGRDSEGGEGGGGGYGQRERGGGGGGGYQREQDQQQSGGGGGYGGGYAQGSGSTQQERMGVEDDGGVPF